jgi:hypothetical protein
MDKPDPKLDRLPPEVTENIAEYLQGDHESLEALRALRLACKELYLKTFRAFAIAYCSNLSVSFNLARLHRLRDVATHKNSFGLSLYTFPRSLTCSTYRLPSGDAVDMRTLCDADPATREKFQATIEAIARAFKKQPGFNSAHHDRAMVRRYIKAASEQCTIETTSYDIKSLAESLAWLPNVRGVGCFGDSKCWGQED